MLCLASGSLSRASHSKHIPRSTYEAFYYLSNSLLLQTFQVPFSFHPRFSASSAIGLVPLSPPYATSKLLSQWEPLLPNKHSKRRLNSIQHATPLHAAFIIPGQAAEPLNRNSLSISLSLSLITIPPSIPPFYLEISKPPFGRNPNTIAKPMNFTYPPRKQRTSHISLISSPPLDISSRSSPTISSSFSSTISYFCVILHCPSLLTPLHSTLPTGCVLPFVFSSHLLFRLLSPRLSQVR